MSLQALANGVVSGLGLAVLGLALQLVYLPTGILFFAIAGLFAIAPYLLVTALSLSWPMPFAVAATVVTVSGLSAVMELLSHGRLAGRGASGGVQLVASLGYYTVIVQFVAATWGSQPRILGAASGHQVWHLSGFVLSSPQLVMAIGAAVVLGMVVAVLQFTNAGLKLRALADNPRQFMVMGHDPRRYRLAAFALSGALAASASLMLAFDLGFDPAAGLNPVLYAFVGLIVGGRRALYGAVLGCVVIGVLRTWVAWSLSARWQDASVFLLMAAFLLVAPAGLLGRRARLEVQ
jgi:branched-chain amino acid transport system permease protein